MRNGIPAAGLSELVHEIRQHPQQGLAHYGVELQWLSGTRSRATCLPMRVGDQHIHRSFEWLVDEPKQLGGSNHAPSPQEYLLSGMGSCLMVAFLVGASVMGIQLSRLSIELHGSLDLAGFTGAREGAPVALSGIRYLIRVAGDGSAEQFEQLRQQAQAHSPNAMSLAQGVAIDGSIEIASAP
jgi:uncharacterized OsmC-like protein